MYNRFIFNWNVRVYFFYIIFVPFFFIYTTTRIISRPFVLLFLFFFNAFFCPCYNRLRERKKQHWHLVNRLETHPKKKHYFYSIHSYDSDGSGLIINRTCDFWAPSLIVLMKFTVYCILGSDTVTPAIIPFLSKNFY